MLTIKQHQNNALPIFLRVIFIKSLDQPPPQPKEKVVELINSLMPRNKMQEVLTISLCKFLNTAFSFIASMSSKYLACMFGECFFKYELTISVGIFPDRKRSIV